MSHIYIYEGAFEKGEKNYAMIQAAAAGYLSEKGIEFDRKDLQIATTAKGKPYFISHVTEFSLSHSGLLWMCLFSQAPCGLDLQVAKDCDYEKITKRYFHPSEQHYVELWGQEGFFRLWVRKEAFCKCTGEGFFSDMPKMTDEEDELSEQIDWQGKIYYFREIPIADDIHCALCSTDNLNIEMRVLG